MRFMNGERFTLDTNVLVYAADRRAGARHRLAIEIVNRASERDRILTIQVLGKFYSASTRQAITLARQWLAIFPTAQASDARLGAAIVRRPFAGSGDQITLSEPIKRLLGLNP